MCTALRCPPISQLSGACPPVTGRAATMAERGRPPGPDKERSRTCPLTDIQGSHVPGAAPAGAWLLVLATQRVRCSTNGKRPCGIAYSRSERALPEDIPRRRLCRRIAEPPPRIRLRSGRIEGRATARGRALGRTTEPLSGRLASRCAPGATHRDGSSRRCPEWTRRSIGLRRRQTRISRVRLANEGRVSVSGRSETPPDRRYELDFGP